MPVGRPDFWWGQVLMFENTPTNGVLTSGPTSNWAYDHNANPDAHHVRYTDAEAQAAAWPVYLGTGDAIAWSKQLADFVCDGLWHEWSMAGWFSVAPKAVILRIQCWASVRGAPFQFKASNIENDYQLTYVTGMYDDMIQTQDVIVAVGPDNKIEYRAWPANWLLFNVLVSARLK